MHAQYSVQFAPTGGASFLQAKRTTSTLDAITIPHARFVIRRFYHAILDGSRMMRPSRANSPWPR